MVLKFKEKKLIIFVKLNLVKTITTDLLNFVEGSKISIEFFQREKRSR